MRSIRPGFLLSLNDFLNVLHELRTINDLTLYLQARRSFCPQWQRTVGIDSPFFEFYVLSGGMPSDVASIDEIINVVQRQQDEVTTQLRTRMARNRQAAPIEELSDRLSERYESWEDGLDEIFVRRFDPTFSRGGYLLMQDELCDLVLDERRKLGTRLAGVISRVGKDTADTSMAFQASHLDSKPDFLYVFSSTKGISRNEVMQRCDLLLHAGMVHYDKARGLAVNYTQDRDGYETMLVTSRREDSHLTIIGKKLFGGLKISSILIEKS